MWKPRIGSPRIHQTYGLIPGDIPGNILPVTVVCVSPRHVYPHTHITSDSDMCIPGGDTQNTDTRLGIRWTKWRLGCEVLVSAVKSRRNQSTGDEKSNRTGKLRRVQLTCMVPMTWKIFSAYLKGLSKYGRMAFFLIIFFRFRDIDVFLLCKVDHRWRHIVCF